MSKSRTIGILVLLGLGAAGISLCAIVALRHSEPSFADKPLSEWLAQLDYSYSPTDRQASNAVLQIGTNALPFLRPMFFAHDSKLKTQIARLLSKQRVLTYSFVPAAEKRKRASRACRVLGPTAIGYLPELTKMLNSPDAGVAWCGFVAVSSVKPLSECVPELIMALTNCSPLVRSTAASRLGGLGANAPTAMPWLQVCLGDSDPDVRISALSALANLGENETQILSTLITMLSDADARVRFNAVSKLGKMGTNAAPALPKLTERLEDKDQQVRLAADMALKKLMSKNHQRTE